MALAFALVGLLGSDFLDRIGLQPQTDYHRLDGQTLNGVGMARKRAFAHPTRDTLRLRAFKLRRNDSNDP
jgi:hypothetical protein